MNPNLNDQFRVDFYHNYIGQMYRAITEDKVNVVAYTAWSLMDNFEWARGYTERFGLHWVNYTGITFRLRFSGPSSCNQLAVVALGQYVKF